MIEEEVLTIKRIDFRDGGTFDGSMLAQTLLRIRNTENVISSVQASVTPLEFVDYENGTPLSAAISSVLLFNAAVTVSWAGLSTSDTGTIYRFGNLSGGEVIISDGTSEILKMVPGEFVRLIRLNAGRWIRTFGP